MPADEYDASAYFCGQKGPTESDRRRFFEVSGRKMHALTRQFLAPFGGGSKSLCRRCVPTRGVAFWLRLTTAPEAY